MGISFHISKQGVTVVRGVAVIVIVAANVGLVNLRETQEGKEHP